MAKKKNKGGGGCENNNNNDNGGGEGEKKKEAEKMLIEVVLKLDLHCDGCAHKIMKSVYYILQGVEAVKIFEGDLTKLVVIGKVDPSKLREAIEKKLKKKVELVSPVPPKNENKNEKENQNCNNKQQKNAGQGEKKENGGEKKPKEIPVSTAVMKLNLHCFGCIKKVQKIVTKTKGYLDMSVDLEKDQITVRGEIVMKDLAQSLANKLKKSVEIVPPKKEGEKKENKDGGCGGGKAKGGDGATGGCDGMMYPVQWEYANQPPFGCSYQVYPVYPPQMFSDENPNACSIM